MAKVRSAAGCHGSLGTSPARPRGPRTRSRARALQVSRCHPTRWHAARSWQLNAAWAMSSSRLGRSWGGRAGRGIIGGGGEHQQAVRQPSATERHDSFLFGTAGPPRKRTCAPAHFEAPPRGPPPQVMDALRMGFPDDSFDLVWACESGEHMPDKKAYVDEMVSAREHGVPCAGVRARHKCACAHARVSRIGDDLCAAGARGRPGGGHARACAGWGASRWGWSMRLRLLRLRWPRLPPLRHDPTASSPCQLRVLKPGGTIVIATWCQRDETPDAPFRSVPAHLWLARQERPVPLLLLLLLQLRRAHAVPRRLLRSEDDRRRLTFLYEEWAHPFFVSKEEYGRIMEVRPAGAPLSMCCCRRARHGPHSAAANFTWYPNPAALCLAFAISACCYPTPHPNGPRPLASSTA